MTTVERAFEVARSGRVRTITEIRAQLVREGFEKAHAHLNGTGLQKQLRALLKTPQDEVN
jgi:hypothetical protein